MSEKEIMMSIPYLNAKPLQVLLKHLKETPDSLPKLDMERWGLFTTGAVVDRPNKVTECCTCLCLLGRLPLLGFPALEDEIWEDYSRRIVGHINPLVWNYLFATVHPADIEAAIERIENVLAAKEARIGESHWFEYNQYLKTISN